MAQYQPAPRFRQTAAQIGHKTFLWGGRTQDFTARARQMLASSIETFNTFNEKWEQKGTTGLAPPGLNSGVCTTVSESLYHFGGYDGHSESNSLHCLNSVTFEWTQVHSQKAHDQPMRKFGCGMTAYHKEDTTYLAIFAGHGIPHGPTQPGASFVQNTGYSDGSGWTNELHLFNLTNGEWTSPPTIGQRPPPCSAFSFTAINHHKAVMFGGYQPEHGVVNDIYIIDFRSMVWTKLERPEGATWPVERSYHAATCLNYGDDHPQLLVTGGLDKKNKTISDGWVLDINTGRWRELTLPEGTQARFGHTLTACRMCPDRVNTTTFGGCPQYVFGDDAKQKLSETTVMEFESVQSGVGSSISEWVLVGVIGTSELGTPERVKQLEKMKQRKTDHDLQLQVEKALKKGYILMDLTTCLATGAPGSGKTHLRYLLYGLFPPDLRISTACIEEAQRAVIGSLDSEDSEESQWKPVQSEGLKEMVAEGVSAGVQGLEEEILVLASHKHDTTPLKSDTTTQTHDPVIAVHDSGSQVTEVPASEDPQPQLQQEAVHAIQPSALLVKETNVPRMQAFELPETSDILKLMKSLSTSKQPLRAHWMHFIDSGGQPQFLEILPAFIRNVSLLLLLVKLSEELSDTPTVEYFSPDGKSYQLGVFPLSNEQLLLQAAQLSLFHQSQISLPHNIIEKEQSQPNMTVVGTFADQESKCKETRSEKNNRLKQLLQPFQKQLIPRSKSEIIFPVNAKSAGQGKNEDPVATELRRVIQKLAPRLRMRFPLLWYFLEMELRRLRLKIVTKSECWEIAKKLGFESTEALEAALLYLHEANLFLYYPDVLSNTIFVDPQAVLTNITHLYERHIKLEDAPESEVVGEDDLRYRDQALFTASALISLDTDYSKAAFPNEDLITLLQNRLIVSEIPFFINDEMAYFMPSLLPALEEGDIIRPKTTAASPLIVSFQEGWAPTGLFCALVVSLLSSKSQLQWKISELVSGNMSKLYKNYLEFSIGYIAGSITLVNTMKQFELHPSSELPSDVLPLIWQTIDHNLKEACSKYSYKVSHRFAFECNCGLLPPHTALISLEKSTVQCSRDPDKVEPLSSKQKLWVLFQSDYAGMDKIEMKNQQIQTEIVKTVEQQVQAGSTAEQQAGMNKIEVKNQQIQTEIVKTVEQHVQAGSTAQQQGYLRGVEVIDHITITYTGSAQSFYWRRFGFKMHLPDHALPPGVNECQIQIQASLSGQFQFPEDTEILSSIYWATCPHKFAKPVTVEIQHCAKPEHLQHPSRLTFIVAKCNQESLPYKFKILDHGVFSPGSRYGSIELTQFSGFGVAFQSVMQWLGLRSYQPQLDPKNYCARLYYSSSGIHSWEVYFAITWDLELHISAIDAKYIENAAKVGPNQIVTFEADEIKLDIAVEGVDLKNGWTITPYTHPGISKHQVDHFTPGSQLPSCQLYVEWTGQQEQPVQLMYRVKLLGAKEPNNFFLIRLPAPQALPEVAQQVPMALRKSSIQQSLTQKYAGLDSEPELSDLMNEVASQVSAKWKDISIQLGLTLNDQKYFMELTLGDPKQCFTFVFTVWKSRATRPYKWSTVIQALESPAVDEKRLAQELRTKLQSQLPDTVTATN